MWRARPIPQRALTAWRRLHAALSVWRLQMSGPARIQCSPQPITINSMRRAIVSLVLLVLSATAAFSQDFSLTQLQGLWTGTLNEGILNLRVAIRFDKNGTGKLDSLDQHVTGIPVTGVRVQGYRVTFRVDSVEGSYSGIVMDDGNRLDGD